MALGACSPQPLRQCLPRTLSHPLTLQTPQEALGGLENTLVYGLRTTAAASAFLLLVHFAAGNAVVVAPRLPRERAPQAPAHAQHALSLLFTTYQVGGCVRFAVVSVRARACSCTTHCRPPDTRTHACPQHTHTCVTTLPPPHTHTRSSAPPTHAHAPAPLQMHFAEAVALAYLFPARFWAQPPALTGLMAASYAAVFILARRWGALRCTWTLAGATKALAARPGEARGGVARACRCVRGCRLRL